MHSETGKELGAVVVVERGPVGVLGVEDLAVIVAGRRVVEVVAVEVVVVVVV